eukprot:TRINITY_DN5024_c0_g1_i1.p3 TRINITY_DN5024_c0_g1~~TRINITY_DN5024_c0_g1_i1.p3  ORF type:complete len:62 (+),score=1.08 TRINITY_DN5024_c0_g1_i1:104-289(+)
MIYCFVHVLHRFLYSASSHCVQSFGYFRLFDLTFGFCLFCLILIFVDVPFFRLEYFVVIRT